MKKRVIIATLVAMLLTSSVSFAESILPFTDVTENNWYYESLCTLYENKVIDGFTDGTFKGSSELRKDQLLKLIVTTVNKYADFSREVQEAYDGAITTEVYVGTWFQPYLDVCRQMRLEENLGNFESKDENGETIYLPETEDVATKFNVSITREEVAEYVYNAYMLGKAYDADDSATDAEVVTKLQEVYNDFNNISSEKYRAIYIMQAKGIMQGDTFGNFNPKNSLTRAEATAIIARLTEQREYLKVNELIDYNSIPGYVYSKYRHEETRDYLGDDGGEPGIIEKLMISDEYLAEIGINLYEMFDVEDRDSLTDFQREELMELVREYEESIENGIME